MDLGPNCKVVLWPQDFQRGTCRGAIQVPDYVTTKLEARNLSSAIIIFAAYAGPRHEGARQ